MLAAITYDFASPAAIERAVSTAMANYELEHAQVARTPPAKSAQLAELDAREADVREQYKAGALPPTVFTAWLSELEKARATVTQAVIQKTRRVTRDEFVRAYRSVVTKRLDVVTKRENAGVAREGFSGIDSSWVGSGGAVPTNSNSR